MMMLLALAAVAVTDAASVSKSTDDAKILAAKARRPHPAHRLSTQSRTH